MAKIITEGLELIGDPVAGRPTLGDSVSVAMFRVLRLVVIMEGLNSIIGDASALVYASGKGLGNELGETIFAKAGKDMDKYISTLANEVKSLGIGIMSVTKADPDSGLIEIKVDECITCSGGPNINQRVCHFEAGLISGLLEPLFGKPVNVVETQCNCMGEDGCLFECRF